MAERNDSNQVKAKIPDSEKLPFFLFRKKQGGMQLTKGQIKEIKQGRKRLRRELKDKGLTSREDFNVLASSLNLYFDRSGKMALLKMFFLGKGGILLLGAAILALLALWMVSWITDMRGHFTVNMSNDLFSEGFVLSESADFTSPTTYLVCTPMDQVPEISISHIPEDVNEYDGMHSQSYLAYTYYVRNEGSSTVDYTWEVALNSESKGVSSAAWVMIFEDDRMVFYARESSEGVPEALPPAEDHTRGYLNPPMYHKALDPEGQYEQVDPSASVPRWRIIPRPFLTDTTVARSVREDMAPGETHKYTIVMWLEGDDPDCTNDLIGGHLGMEVRMALLEETDPAALGTWDNFRSKVAE